MADNFLFNTRVCIGAKVLAIIHNNFLPLSQSLIHSLIRIYSIILLPIRTCTQSFVLYKCLWNPPPIHFLTISSRKPWGSKTQSLVGEIEVSRWVFWSLIGLTVPYLGVPALHSPSLAGSLRNSGEKWLNPRLTHTGVIVLSRESGQRNSWLVWGGWGVAGAFHPCVDCHLCSWDPGKPHLKTWTCELAFKLNVLFSTSNKMAVLDFYYMIICT